MSSIIAGAVFLFVLILVGVLCWADPWMALLLFFMDIF